MARVNGEPITERRLASFIDADRLSLGPRAVSARDTREVRAKALRLAIRAELVYQAALRTGLDVPESEVDRQLEVARSQFPTEEDFLTYLERSGSSTDRIRAEARRRLLIEAYAATVTDAIEIDDARLDELSATEQMHASDHEQVRVAQILVRLRPDDDAERRKAARAKIEEAHRRAIAGDSFAELARLYSESPLAAQGGDMGYLPRGRMLPEFDAVIFDTPVGQISDVFETRHGLNIVKILDRKSVAPTSDEEIRTGLLLVLARDQSGHALRAHIDALEREATIEILDPDLR